MSNLSFKGLNHVTRDLRLKYNTGYFQRSSSLSPHNNVFNNALNHAVVQYKLVQSDANRTKITKVITHLAENPNRFLVSDIGILLMASLKSGDTKLCDAIVDLRKQGIKEVGDAIHATGSNKFNAMHYAEKKGYRKAINKFANVSRRTERLEKESKQSSLGI